MDRAVLESCICGLGEHAERCAAWFSLADRAEPIFLDETNEDDHHLPRPPLVASAFRDEVLSRLSPSTPSAPPSERAAGLSPLSDRDEDQEEVEV